MIGQNLYYLNNSKYISTLENLDTVIGELNSYYHTATPRNIVLVHPSNGAQLLSAQYESIANTLRANANDLISYMNFADVDDVDFIQNSDKRIVLFSTCEDMIKVFARYTSGLITASGFYDSSTNVTGMVGAFLEKVFSMDAMLTMVLADETINDVSNHVDALFSTDSGGGAVTPYTVIYQNGKNFSYDLLFWLNDYHRNASVQSLIKEKFTVHQSTMAQDVMEHFTSRRHYLAYILSVIDWMNANTARNAEYATNKTEWVRDCYITKANAGNYTAAFYKLEELWNLVKADTAFIAAHQDKADSDADGWEYMDLYTEFKNVFPIVRKVLQNDFDMDNLTADLKLINTDVQFFSKRQNRIPYLIHKYPL
tara:strand:- start:802 stop:1905 length:1104 start_codon:yes stop_codon:yes gene_type:complete